MNAHSTKDLKFPQNSGVENEVERELGHGVGVRGRVDGERKISQFLPDHVDQRRACYRFLQKRRHCCYKLKR